MSDRISLRADEDLKALDKLLCMALTPFPWKTVPLNARGGLDVDDAKLIITAINALPKLLKELETLRRAHKTASVILEAVEESTDEGDSAQYIFIDHKQVSLTWAMKKFEQGADIEFEVTKVKS